uniref:Uncharacterized protein n=1 Tax=Arundo donax TaxID=35708 RepID=A0A0A9F2D2_ARUDO
MPSLPSPPCAAEMRGQGRSRGCGEDVGTTAVEVAAPLPFPVLLSQLGLRGDASVHALTHEVLARCKRPVTAHQDDVAAVDSTSSPYSSSADRPLGRPLLRRHPSPGRLQPLLPVLFLCKPTSRQATSGSIEDKHALGVLSGTHFLLELVRCSSQTMHAEDLNWRCRLQIFSDDDIFAIPSF